MKFLGSVRVFGLCIANAAPMPQSGCLNERKAAWGFESLSADQIEMEMASLCALWARKLPPQADSKPQRRLGVVLTSVKLCTEQ